MLLALAVTFGCHMPLLKRGPQEVLGVSSIVEILHLRTYSILRKHDDDMALSVARPQLVRNTKHIEIHVNRFNTDCNLVRFTCALTLK